MKTEVCKNAKCSNATKPEDLCPEHLAEYDKYLDELAERAAAQERYEQGKTDEYGNGEVA